jgi:hypothetical protein
MNLNMYLNPCSVSLALACVYELVPGGNSILHVFNNDAEAKMFWEQGKSSNKTDGCWLYVPSGSSRYNLKWNEKSKIKCSERLWLYVSHYNGCSNETVCTTTLLKRFIDNEGKNPYFERAEIFPL